MGALGPSWKRLGSLLGACWGFLGCLRAPKGALGASWGALGSIFFGHQILIFFWIDFDTEKGPQREAFRDPKWNQNPSKIEVENEDEKKSLLGGSWVDFGSFWETSWGEKSSKFIGGANIS